MQFPNILNSTNTNSTQLLKVHKSGQFRESDNIESGTLNLNIIEAKLHRNTELFSEMDPYIQIIHKNKQYKTKAIQEGGKFPKWNEKLVITDCHPEDELKIICFDEDIISDCKVAEHTYKVRDIAVLSKHEWFKLFFKNKLAAEVLIDATFYDAADIKQQQQVSHTEKRVLKTILKKTPEHSQIHDQSTLKVIEHENGQKLSQEKSDMLQRSLRKYLKKRGAVMPEQVDNWINEQDNSQPAGDFGEQNQLQKQKLIKLPQRKFAKKVVAPVLSTKTLVSTTTADSSPQHTPTNIDSQESGSPQSFNVQNKLSKFVNRNKKINMSLGTLQLTIVGGRLTRDTEMFTKMDPFVVMKYGNQTYKTKTHQEGGVRPIWNESFELPVFDMSDEIKFFCYDEDITFNDLIGEAIVQVNYFISESPMTKEKLEIFYQGKKSGDIVVWAKYRPNSRQEFDNSLDSTLEQVTPSVATEQPKVRKILNNQQTGYGSRSAMNIISRNQAAPLPTKSDMFFTNNISAAQKIGNLNQVSSPQNYQLQQMNQQYQSMKQLPLQHNLMFQVNSPNNYFQTPQQIKQLPYLGQLNQGGLQSKLTYSPIAQLSNGTLLLATQQKSQVQLFGNRSHDRF